MKGVSLRLGVVCQEATRSGDLTIYEMWNTPQNIWDVKYPSEYMRCEIPLRIYEMWNTPQNIWGMKYPSKYLRCEIPLLSDWITCYPGIDTTYTSDLKYLFRRERRGGVLVEWCISCENVSYVGLSCVRAGHPREPRSQRVLLVYDSLRRFSKFENTIENLKQDKNRVKNKIISKVQSNLFEKIRLLESVGLWKSSRSLVLVAPLEHLPSRGDRLSQCTDGRSTRTNNNGRRRIPRLTYLNTYHFQEQVGWGPQLQRT